MPNGDYNSMDLQTLLEISRNSVIVSTNLLNRVDNHSQRIDDNTQKIDALTERMEQREQSELVSPDQKKAIRKAVNRQVYKMLGLRKKRGKLDHESKKVRKIYGGLFYSRIYNDLYERFGVSAYEEIKAIDFDEATAFIVAWVPADGINALKYEAEENWADNHPDVSLREFLES